MPTLTLGGRYQNKQLLQVEECPTESMRDFNDNMILSTKDDINNHQVNRGIPL